MSNMYNQNMTPEEMQMVALLSGNSNESPEIGYYELAGNVIAQPAMRANPAAMPTRPQQMGSVAVQERQPTTSRVLFVGFKSAATIAAAASSNVESQPQDTFAPRKVIVPATVAPNFEINDIKIGSVSQLSSSDAIPAETFIPEAVNTDVRFDTAQISQKISFSVTNISAAAATFRACMNGFVVRL